MENKFDFYEEHGVEEYYVYDPDKVTLNGWVRLGKKASPCAEYNRMGQPEDENPF